MKSGLRRISFSFLMLILFSAVLNAGKPEGFGLSLSLSPYPAMHKLGHTYNPIKTSSDKVTEFDVLYSRNKYSGRMTSIGTYTLDLDFYTGTLFSIGISASFETDRITIRENKSGNVYFSSNQSFIVPMLSIKANWFNRPSVRLYSYAGVGRWMRISSFNEVNEDSRKSDKLGLEYEQDIKGTAYHICPVGVSYGKKKLAVFAELGYGARCVIGEIGVSYRFGKKI